MNDCPRPPELLGRSHVAMAERARANVCLDASQSRLSRADPAFRSYRATWVAPLSFNRVPAPKGQAVEQGRLCSGVRWNLRGDALQDRFSQTVGNQGTGARRHLFSKTSGEK